MLNEMRWPSRSVSASTPSQSKRIASSRACGGALVEVAACSAVHDVREGDGGANDCEDGMTARRRRDRVTMDFMVDVYLWCDQRCAVRSSHFGFWTAKN